MPGDEFPPTPKGTYKFAEKWGPTVSKSGFTAIPNCLISINEFVPKEQKLSSTEIVVLLNLINLWWDADRFPFPSKSALSRRTGISPRQIQRALRALESKKYISSKLRVVQGKGRTSNVYDLSGLVPIAEKIITEKNLARKRPQGFP